MNASPGSPSHFVRYSLYTFIVQTGVTAMMVATAVLSARFLGPEGKGILTLLILIPVLGVTFGRCGLGNAVIYYAPHVPRPDLVLNGLVLNSALGALVALLTLPVVLVLKSSLFRAIPSSWLVGMCALVFFYFVYDFVNYLLIAQYRIPARNFLILFFPTTYLVLFVVLVGFRGGKVKGAVWAWSLALLISSAAALVLLGAKAGRGGAGLDPALMKRLLSFGLKSHWGMTMEFMNYRADFYLVGFLANPASVGLYSAAVNMAEVGWKFPDAVKVILMPSVAGKPPAQTGVFIPKICRVLFFSVTVLCAALALGRRPLILFFFGEAFLPAARAFLILLPGFAAFVVWKILAYGLIVQGHPHQYSWTAALAFLTMIALDAALIPRMGIVGAALASTAAYVAATGAVAVLYRRTNPCSWRDLFIPRRGDWVVLLDYLKSLKLSSKHARPGR
jgi:O-antigen/teichoic acid export membrane protein